ncbi:pyruvate dehydrogenase complex dihydrolipoamide acetyltransferase [Alphaproteobacteria bacterium LSUCC0684]
MAIITMPALSPTMTEGKLARWLVKEGDSVRSGDVIAEIETDKAVMEVEALDDGVLARIGVAEGTEGVKVGAAIAEILAEGEESRWGEAESTDQPPEKADPAEPAAQSGKPAHPETAPATGSDKDGSSRIFASPLARRLAAERGIDLALVKGSGPHGRIIRADIDGAGAGMTASPGIEAMPAAPALAMPAPSPVEASTLVENSQMRRIIAERLQQSKLEAPHFYLNMDIEIEAMLAARKALNAHAPEGVKVSVNDMIIKAAAVALKMVPGANASWEGTHTRLYAHADIAVAVAVDGGLVTPVVARAEEKGLYAISREMVDLSTRARAGKLLPEEFNGGSFTISNLGMYGITSFSAVINPPQGAILAIGAGEERPVARNGEVKIATMMTATLSCDHRVVDGAIGARWLAAFKQVVENPVLALG